MAKTHKVEIILEINGVSKQINGEMSFSNGKEQEFEFTALPPSSTIACSKSLNKVLERIDDYKVETKGDIIKIEVTKL